jgi:NADH:ubiquinone oxidoreductase subunit K
MNIPLEHYLLIAGILMMIGVLMVLTKKSAIMILMGIELIFNAANINMVAFNRFDRSGFLQGQVFSLFIMVVAVAEAAIALAIILKVYSYYNSSNPDEVNTMKG